MPDPAARIQGVIFDFDGVLVDSEPYWEEADRRTLASLGATLGPDAKRALIGLQQDVAARMILEMHGLETDPLEFRRQRNTLMSEFYRDVIPVFDGALDVVAHLQASGLRLGVASSTPRELLLVGLRRHGLDRFFPIVVSADDVKHGKPAPDIFLRTLDLLSLEARESLVIEDSLPGILAANAAGIRSVWVSNEHSAGAGKDATYVVESVREVPALVRRLGAVPERARRAITL